MRFLAESLVFGDSFLRRKDGIMSEDQVKLTHIEKLLLDREIKEICEGIAKVGEHLDAVFKKYQPMSGKFSDELQKFLVDRLRLASTSYIRCSYETNGGGYIHPDWIPAGLKRAILKWASQDFINRVEGVQSEIAEIQDMLP